MGCSISSYCINIILLTLLNIIIDKRWTWRKGARLFNKRASPSFSLQCLALGSWSSECSGPHHYSQTLTHWCPKGRRTTQNTASDNGHSSLLFLLLHLVNQTVRLSQSDIAQNNHVHPYRLNAFACLVGFCQSTDVNAVSIVPDPC